MYLPLPRPDNQDSPAAHPGVVLLENRKLPRRQPRVAHLAQEAPSKPERVSQDHDEDCQMLTYDPNNG